MIRHLLTAVAVATVLAAGCGDDDTGDETGGATQSSTTAAASEAEPVSIEEWVAEFDRLCVETTETLSDPALTEAQFSQISASAVAEMRSIGVPSTRSDEAMTLLEVISAQTTGPEPTQEELDAQDARFLQAATSLGISDECLRGVPG